MQLFAQALVGAENFRVPGFTETGFAFQPGGGADLPFTKSLKARAQADYRLAHQGKENTTFHEFRFAASIVFGFK
jgi:hypothetical protein